MRHFRPESALRCWSLRSGAEGSAVGRCVGRRFLPLVIRGRRPHNAETVAC